MNAGAERKVAWLAWTAGLTLTAVLVLARPKPVLSLQPVTDGALAQVGTTYSPTPEPSATYSATPEPSITPTSTLELSPTLSPTPSETATNTLTPDGTLTATPTTDPNATTTDTPTPTPTVDPNITPSPTEEPTVTPTESPTPTATPRAAALPLIWRQLRHLQNGGLESGSFVPGWSIAGNLSAAVVRSERHWGVFAARIGDPTYDSEGGCPTGEASMGQVIDVPQSGPSTLHFWYNIYSYDTIDFDYFAVTITRVSTGETRHVWLDGRIDWTPQLWVSGWQHGTVPLNDYAGQAVTVRFHNVLTNQDGWYNTWTFVDDVSLSTP